MDKRKFVLFRSDYWNEKCVSVDIYVPFESYTDSNKEDIERELATLIGKELLNKNLLSFYDSWKPDDYGDIRVHCQANVLELKNREGKMPARLKDLDNGWVKAYIENQSKGADTMNEQNRTD